MAKRTFKCSDNGGYFQCFDVTAKDKTEAIKKGMEKAKKKAKGDISPTWKCTLKSIQEGENRMTEYERVFHKKELDRELFVALYRDEPTRHMYYITNDQMPLDRFYADNDEAAIAEFRDRIEKHELVRK